MAFLATLCLLLVAGFSAAQVNITSPARIEDFPSVVQIEFGAGPIWVQTCVGTILTNYHVLSAAHCFFGRTYAPRFRRVRAGATYRGRDGQILSVQSATNHPSFNARDFEADISVVRLTSPLTFSSTIQTASIIGPDISLPITTSVTFAGWGRTAQNNTWADRQLNSADLRVVTLLYCDTQYGSLPVYLPITDDMICVGQPGALGTNIGLRDTGAPLFYDGILVGVVVFGSPVGETFPLVAVSVSSFNRWIIANAV